MVVERANALNFVAGTEDHDNDCCEQLNGPMLPSGSIPVIVLAGIVTVG